MSAEQFPAATQSATALMQGAEGADLLGAPVSGCLGVPPAKPSLSTRMAQLAGASDQTSAAPTCQQSLVFNFFFDGTGNNLDADTPTSEHSNVARLFLSHLEDEKTIGRYRFYVPGIGTYFKEIGDPGGTTTGLAFGAEGDKRLDWAFKQIDEKLAYHEALAQNVRNKITMIRVAAFGFSRGATLARAFSRMLHEKCERRGAKWVLKKGGHPIRLTFLGLWDTVASVGLPMSTNNTPVAQSLDWISTQTALNARNNTPTGVRTIAFGQPGADPAPGIHDGHMSWAHPLDIGPMVEQCVHMVAGHELRNSFPLDSCRRDGHYPSSVREMVYPGVHSDVGGGYRPGEGARSDKPGQMLSLIPLRAMHQAALEAGIPLYPLSGLPTDDLKEYFSVDETSKAEFDTLLDHWNHYMDTAGRGGRGIGEMFNAHMRVYYGWRFYKIRLNQAARAAGQDTADEATLKQQEAAWKREKAALKKKMDAAQKTMATAQRRVTAANSRLRQAESAQMETGVPVDPNLQTAVQEAEAGAAGPTDDYLKIKAQFDTLPGTEGQLARNLSVYDAQLISDAQAIRDVLRDSPGTPVRPHYRNLLEAYLAEFEENRGLRDEKIITFFDRYVHDSLAGFARDATLPSDPRVIYLGDDVKSRHASIVPIKQPVDVELT